jgi:hypothetical protein
MQKSIMGSGSVMLDSMVKECFLKKVMFTLESEQQKSALS